MSQLNNTFIENLKREFDNTRFSSKDFSYNYPASGTVLVAISFKYDETYVFKISEEEEYEIITQKDTLALAMGGSSEKKNKSVATYVTYSPGQYKKKDKVEVYDIGSAGDHIGKWCRYIYNEVSHKEENEYFFDNLREEMEEQFKGKIENEEESFNDDELGTISARFDDLLVKFESLEEDSKITQEELNRIKDELENFKITAKVLPKGLWARVTSNKLVDIVVSFGKSKEGRDLIISQVKKLMSGD